MRGPRVKWEAGLITGLSKHLSGIAVLGLPLSIIRSDPIQVSGILARESRAPCPPSGFGSSPRFPEHHSLLALLWIQAVDLPRT